MVLRLGWKRPERRNLSSREKPLGDLHHRQIQADTLEVDTYLPATRDRVKGDAVGVGNIEADCVRAIVSGKGRFAMSAVAKGHAFRHSIQVAAEDGPEHTTSNNKVIAVLCEIKPRRPLPFIRGKGTKETFAQ